MSTAFSAGERKWHAGLGKLGDVVRQALVARQLARHLPPPPVRIIDCGCGQGTQALRFAWRGYLVTGWTPHLLEIASVPLALIGELAAELAPPAVGDGAGQVPVADPYRTRSGPLLSPASRGTGFLPGLKTGLPPEVL
jgi:hypothetical protein